MIKHIVLLAFKSNMTEEEIASIMKQLGDLRSIIPAIKSFCWGANCSPEQLNKGFNHAFIMEFADIAGRDFYLEHEEHIRVAQEVIVPALENGLQSALTFDFAG